jgi:hypothetical protein
VVVREVKVEVKRWWPVSRQKLTDFLGESNRHVEDSFGGKTIESIERIDPSTEQAPSNNSRG